MFKGKFLIFTALMVFFTSVYAKKLDNFVVFGDSLSDNGNLYEYLKHQLPPSPPYFEGRFCNGYVWVEQLAKVYYPDSWKQHILNYAFGGAGVAWSFDDENSSDEDDVLFSLGSEIDSYLLAHQDKASPNSLFTVWIGANNYIANHYSPEKVAAGVKKGIRKSLELLATKGAKHILVINLPDMGKSPAARMIYSEKELSLCSKFHNEGLRDTVADLTKKYPKVQWVLFDAAEVYAEALANPEKYGFTNITDTCYQSLVNAMISEADDTQFILKMSASLIKNEQLAKDACDGYFFFDPVHPTALTHKILANILQDVLKDNNLEFGKS